MRNIIFITLIAVMFILSGCAEKVSYSASDFLDPLEAGQDIDIPEQRTFKKPKPPFTENPDWVNKLNKFIPIHAGASFLPDDNPIIERQLLDNAQVRIEARIYYKVSSEEIFAWTADHLIDVGMNENRNLPEGENTFLFVPADGSGTIKATDGVYSMDIDFERDATFDDWVSVTYSGYRYNRSE